ncbi:MAG: hypothetical protein ACM3N3_06490, partial [Betaproteobacteria bacterium]
TFIASIVHPGDHRSPVDLLLSLCSLMKIPISGKIARSYGPPPLQKGLLGDFSALVPTHCGLFSCAVLYRVVHELLCG